MPKKYIISSLNVSLHLDYLKINERHYYKLIKDLAH